MVTIVYDYGNKGFAFDNDNKIPLLSISVHENGIIFLICQENLIWPRTSILHDITYHGYMNQHKVINKSESLRVKIGEVN